MIIHRPLIEELNIEIVNEVYVCFTYLLVHVYSDATPSAQDRYYFGWIVITLFFMLFIINIVHILIPAVRELKQKCKKKTPPALNVVPVAAEEKKEDQNEKNSFGFDYFKKALPKVEEVSESIVDSVGDEPSDSELRVLLEEMYHQLG